MPLEPGERIELSTSFLPRMRSATELPRLCAGTRMVCARFAMLRYPASLLRPAIAGLVPEPGFEPGKA